MNVTCQHGGSHDIEEIEMSPGGRARLAPTGTTPDETALTARVDEAVHPSRAA